MLHSEQVLEDDLGPAKLFEPFDSYIPENLGCCEGLRKLR